MTLEQAKAELKDVTKAYFAEVEKLMDQGIDYLTAVMTVSKSRSDLNDREAQLRGYIKALSGVADADLSADSLSCAVVSGLAGSAVKRIAIAQLGVRYRGKQRIEITRPMLAEISTNFRKRDTGEVPIDYDHAIEVSAGNGQAVPAAGWIKSIDDAPDGQGILWGSVEWTPKAAAMIAAKEYKYLSPVIDPGVRSNTTGEPQGWTLTSAALTNQPVLQGMPALVLSEVGRYGAGREEGQVTNNEWDALNVEINQRVKEIMAAKSLGYGPALRALMLSDRDLARRYQAAKARWLGGQTLSSSSGVDVASEIHALAKGKVAASEGRMGYPAAMQWVLSERPDLARRHKNSMRG